VAAMTGADREELESVPLSVSVVKWGLRAQGWLAVLGGVTTVVVMAIAEQQDPSSGTGDAAPSIQLAGLLLAAIGALPLVLAHLVGQGSRSGLGLTVVAETLVLLLGGLASVFGLMPIGFGEASLDGLAVLAAAGVNVAILVAGVHPTTWRWAVSRRTSLQAAAGAVDVEAGHS
jgi:hypothetical protein